MNDFTLRKLKNDRKHYKGLERNEINKQILNKINEAIAILQAKPKSIFEPKHGNRLARRRARALG